MKSSKAIFLFLCSILFVMLLFASVFQERAVATLSDPCAMDPNNLIVNGSMIYANPDNTLAANWNAFVLEGAPVFERVDNEGIDNGHSQYIWSDAATFDAGIYQTVNGLAPGNYYQFRWGLARTAYDPGDTKNHTYDLIGRQLGVDLSGGTDPNSASVAWGTIFWPGSAATNRPELSRLFAAQTSHTTFFLRNINTSSNYRNKVWMDAICMWPTDAPPLSNIVYLPLMIKASAPTCTISHIGTITVGAHPKGIAVDSATNRAFVSLYDSSSVAVINSATNSVTATWSTNNSGHANGIGMTSGKVFVALRDTNSVAILDGTSGAFIANRTVGSQPYGVGAANGYAWIANFNSNSVSVVDAGTLNVTTSNVGGNPALVAPSNDRAFVSYWTGGVQVVGTDSSPISDFTASGGGSFGVALNTAVNRLYVSNRDTNQIFVFNASTGSIITSVTLAQTPYALAYNPSTNHLFVVLADVNQVDVRDGTTLDSITTVSVGNQGADGGDGIAVLNGQVYISNNAAGTVSVLSDSCP
ncbi:MAG: YncE family protein [Chloroflexi bacterium]|nr:YncE family protein [Chloroflexota bacterium]